MKLKDILAISGKPGLYKFVSQGRNGIIVEGFADKKRMIVHSTTKVSALEDIAIYTEVEEVPLKDILKKLYEKEEGKKTIDSKSPIDQLKALFEEVLPDYDRDRVYTSDIKKVVSWYNIMIEHDLIDPNEPEDEENKDKDEVSETVKDDKKAPEATDDKDEEPQK